MSDFVRRIVDAYDAPVVRAYSRVRFVILHQRFLDEIGQYLPERGNVLDIGCGFGLFSLYFALARPGVDFTGVDLSGRRIGMARRAAERLSIRNARYVEGNATTFDPDSGFEAAYMLDIVHHIPPDAVEPLIARLHRNLVPGGRLIIKDVDDRPFLKRWFTWWLDKAVDPSADVNYWPPAELRALLVRNGFRVYSHSMVDILPYPHRLFICEKAGGGK